MAITLFFSEADVADLVMSSKLFGRLASGRPVLATAHPGTQLAKVVSSCGKVVEPGNAQEVVQGLLELLHSPQARATNEAALLLVAPFVNSNFISCYLCQTDFCDPTIQEFPYSSA